MSILSFTKKRTSVTLESDLYIKSAIQKQPWNVSPIPKKNEEKKTLDIRSFPPGEWSEEIVYRHLTTRHNKFNPHLDSIEEILIRSSAGSKVRCCFLNSEKKVCKVWVPVVVMKKKYGSVFSDKLSPLRGFLDQVFLKQSF